MNFFSFLVPATFLILTLLASSAHAASEAQASLYISTPETRGYTIPDYLSHSERSWFKTFQEGNLLSDGWQKISADVLAKTPEKDRPAQKDALTALGMKIGLEWCRSNSERKVTTNMLKQWGDLLKSTAKQNPQQLLQVIARIDREVDALLR